MTIHGQEEGVLHRIAEEKSHFIVPFTVSPWELSNCIIMVRAA